MPPTITIQWPSAARPARATSDFIAGTNGVGIYAPQGTVISAGAPGLVIVVTGDTVQIASGQTVVTYRNLQNIRMKGGETVKAGDVLGESAGPESIMLMVHQEHDPTPLLVQPPADSEPAPKPDAGPVYVRPKSDGLRIREQPVDVARRVARGQHDGVSAQLSSVRQLYARHARGFAGAQYVRYPCTETELHAHALQLLAQRRQARRRLIRGEEFARMRLERHQRRRQPALGRFVPQSREHRLMPEMDPVEIADGERDRGIGACGDGSEDAHETAAKA